MRVVFVLGLLGSFSAHAITTVESNAGLQFSYNNPGARSMGMGGAFSALADDATAAFANPAGLTILSQPEFSFEVRGSDYQTIYSDSGRLIGEASGIGLDTQTGIVTGSSESSVTSLGFISYARPISDKAAIAFFRHQMSDFEAEFQSAGPFVEPLLDENGAPRFAPDGTPLLSRLQATRNRTDVDIANYGASIGYRVSDDFSLGFTLSYFDGDLESNTERFGQDINGDGRVDAQERISVVSFDQSLRIAEISQDVDDEEFGFSAGFLWNISEKFAMGGFYRSGPSFDMTWRQFDFRDNAERFSGQTDFDTPDAYGVGFAYFPSSAWRFALDISRLEYSDMTDEVFLNATGVPVSFLESDDATEVRFGGEYVFATENPIAIRFGAWQESEHQIRFTDPIVPGDNSANARAALFLEGDDETHITAGAGMVFNNFQLDFAADFSDRADIWTISSVFRF